MPLQREEIGKNLMEHAERRAIKVLRAYHHSTHCITEKRVSESFSALKSGQVPVLRTGPLSTTGNIAGDLWGKCFRQHKWGYIQMAH